MAYSDHATTLYQDQSKSPNYVAFNKDTAFAWEHELRALIDQKFPPNSDRELGELSAFWGEDLQHYDDGKHVGMKVPIFPSVLIDEVIVNPKADDDFFEQVVAFCKEHNLEKPIVHSSLE